MMLPVVIHPYKQVAYYTAAMAATGSDKHEGCDCRIKRHMLVVSIQTFLTPAWVIVNRHAALI